MEMERPKIQRKLLDKFWRKWVIVYSSPNLVISYRFDGTKTNPQFYCYVQTSWSRNDTKNPDKLGFGKEFYVVLGIQTVFYSRPINREYQKWMKRFAGSVETEIYERFYYISDYLHGYQLPFPYFEVRMEELAVHTPKGKIVPTMSLSTQFTDLDLVIDIRNRYSASPYNPDAPDITEEGNRWKVVWGLPFVAFVGDLLWEIDGTEDIQTIRSVYEQLQNFSLKSFESVVKSVVMSEGIPKIYETLRKTIAEVLEDKLAPFYVPSLDEAFEEISSKKMDENTAAKLILSGLFGHLSNHRNISIEVKDVWLYSDIDMWIGGEVRPYPILYGDVITEVVFRDPGGTGPLTQSLLSILNESLQIDEPKKFAVALSLLKDEVNQGWISHVRGSDPAGYLIEEILEAIEKEQS